MTASGLQVGTYVPFMIPEKGKLYTTKLINPTQAYSYYSTQELQKKQKMTVRKIPHIKSSLIPGLQMQEE